MILNLEQVKNVTCGAESVICGSRGFEFRRFTEEQTKAYIKYRDELYGKKTLTDSGVRLAFTTNSASFSMAYGHYTDHSLGFGWIEVFVDGKDAGKFPVDINEEGIVKLTELGAGIKNIEIYLPWHSNVTLSDITLEDGALLKPLRRSKIMMAFGDSITNGYCAQLTSRTYAAQLAVKLDADLYNKAISADRFFPELLDVDEPVTPDIITVAYGTNDWYHHSRETITRRSRQFLERLSKKFPSARVFAVSPIWRANSAKREKFTGPLTEIHGIIEKAAEGLSNVTVINGWGLVPDAPEYYADGLHPHDFGMDFYAENLEKEIRKHL